MTTTDEELVARAQGGDVESFNQLIVRWERPIYALAYRVIGKEEDARDVCQDAFLRAYRALPGFKGQAKFSSWLYRIALNLCRDWIRRQRRAPVSQLPEVADMQGCPLSTVKTRLYQGLSLLRRRLEQQGQLTPELVKRV
jgi:RNA polymerase sigma-70 factor (ECF subfamily)